MLTASLSDGAVTGVLVVVAGALGAAQGSYLVESRRPVAGNALMVVTGSTAQLCALRFISESEVAALGGIVASITVVLARMRGERVSRREWVACGVVVVASAVVARAAPALAPPAHMPHLTLVVGGYVCVFLLGRGAARVAADGPVRGAVAAGLVGGFTNTLTKAWVFGGVEVWGLGALVFASAQLALLNVALATWGARAVNPVYHTALMVSVVCVGGAAFGEFDAASPAAAGVFCAAAAVSAAASLVLALASPTVPHQKPSAGGGTGGTGGTETVGTTFV